MEQRYSESMLAGKKKPELYAIMVELGIEEGVSKNAPIEEMIARILAKMPPEEPLADEQGADAGKAPDETRGKESAPEMPDNSKTDEPKPDDEASSDGQGAGAGKAPGDALPDDEQSANVNKTPGEESPDDDLPKFTPEQLIKSSTYSHRRDVLRTLLDDDKNYSHAQIAAMLKKFYEREDKTLKPRKGGEKA
ncbi:MAG: hypothetical protein FWC70_08095 [Defluviitaleaceae bacterium]|nr:hypothetical protein [Defluviitaleaceae bacterium]